MHLGARPDAGRLYSARRGTEIWESFRKLIGICEREKPDLLLIAGDLFHRQPLKGELKEVDALFASLRNTKIVLIAGNHDYIKRDSYYLSFPWSRHVHVLSGESMEVLEFPSIETAVYGLSYHAKQVREPLYDTAYPQKRQKVEILLAHGGDAEHIPLSRERLRKLGYDYVALGHIHRPQILIPDMAAYAGALEPTDSNDMGPHGYIKGEILKGRTRFTFMPFASREYIHCEIEVDRKTTGAELRKQISNEIEKRGIQNIYKFLLKGYRDPDVLFDPDSMDPLGNVIHIADETKPFYDMEKLYRNNRNNLIGKYIESFADAEEHSVEYAALCQGIRALMETRRGAE